MKLTIELIPKSAWDNNLRSYLTQTGWDKVRRKCYAEANHVCEICGGFDKARKANGHSPVDCHERWDFVDGEVKLIGVISLCPTCHMVKHIGKAERDGKFKIALRHFMKVNKISENDAMTYIRGAAALWRERSKYEWSLNIDYLTEYMGPDFKFKRPQELEDDDAF